jgi:N-acetylglucosaminyl-diphospho-decaprenol L-rhamnosyltransferase
MTTTLPIDVVAVTWNSREMILRCLDRLNSSLVQTIVVVDNGSNDGTAAAIRAHRPGIDLVRLERPHTLSAAYNRGAERGSAELVLFLNDDLLASDVSIKALAQTLLRRPDAVAAAGRLVEPDTGETQVQYQPRPFPTLATYAATFAGLHPRFPALDDTTTVTVEQPPGACLLVRRAEFEATGRWDERFEFWYEDVDLARRLRRYGAVLYVPSAPFEHMGGWSARRLNRSELVSRNYRGALLYACKHFGTAERIGAGLLYAAVAASRIALSPRDRESRAAYSRVLRGGLRLALRGRLSRP